MSEAVKVKLHIVLKWTCPKCGQDRYHTGREISVDAKEELEEDGLDPSDFAAAPLNVYCGPCDTRYDVDLPDDPDKQFMIEDDDV